MIDSLIPNNFLENFCGTQSLYVSPIDAIKKETCTTRTTKGETTSSALNYKENQFSQERN